MSNGHQQYGAISPVPPGRQAEAPTGDALKGLLPTAKHWTLKFIDNGGGKKLSGQQQWHSKGITAPDLPFKVNHGWLKPTHLCAGNLQRF